MKRLWLHLSAGVGLCVLLILSGLFWLEASRRFPLPPSGEYIGAVSGVLTNGDLSTIPFYLERRPRSSRLLISVFQEGWKPEFVPVQPGDESSRQWISPVFLKQNDLTLRLIGDMKSSGELLGTAFDTTHSLQGEWKLVPMRKRSGGPPDSLNELQDWLITYSKRDELRAKLDGLRLRLQEQQNEIERLTQVITQGKELKAEGQDKFEKASARLKKVQDELAKARAEASQHEKRLEMASRVTEMGKLVTLARESLQRENRWIDSILKTTNRDITSEIKSRYQRGVEILELQKNIALERERIQQLQSRGQAG